jgi:hypothetical protein
MIWRNESAGRSLIVLFVLVGVGVRIATVQNSAAAIAAGLIRGCDFRFHPAAGKVLALPVPSEIVAQCGQKISKSFWAEDA